MRAILERALKRLGFQPISKRDGHWMSLARAGVRVRFTPRLMVVEVRRQSDARRAGVWERHDAVALRDLKPRGAAAVVKRLLGLAHPRVPVQWDGQSGRQRYAGPRPVRHVAGGGKVKGMPPRRLFGW